MNELLLVVIVQVCLESLPISSSGHMMLASMLCEKLNNFSYALPEHFDHFLHGPTLVVLLTFFFSSWWPVVKRCAGALAAAVRGCKLSDSQQRGVRLAMHVISWAFVADVVSVGVYSIGKLLFKFGLPAVALAKEGIMPNSEILLIGFCVTMLLFAALWVHEKYNDNNKNFLGFINSALILGFVQGLALVPGISRFAINFVTARLLGYPPRRAFQASFVIFIPLVIAGFLVNGVGELIKHPEWFEIFTPALIVTMLLSTIVAYALFVLAHRIVLARKMSMFGLYMIVPIGLLVWLMVG
ncbi:undecaprenyl-diphosphate phosphatase [Candidatus Dependentiae bacterium]|nr:undecaprenyl-diphosphate phosphatase [Candidatus Dependentiae bacterium]